MCLAVPMQLIEKCADDLGIAELDGIRCSVNISLIDEPALGDYLIVHAGFAIEKLDEEEAEARLQLFAELRGEES